MLYDWIQKILAVVKEINYRFVNLYTDANFIGNWFKRHVISKTQHNSVTIMDNTFFNRKESLRVLCVSGTIIEFSDSKIQVFS